MAMAFFSLVFPAFAADLTALEAVALLPPGAAARLAYIQGRDARWYFIVRDDAAENGLHEYVVADGRIAASRSLSQFVAKVAPSDVVGVDSITVDSDRAESIARDYAAELKPGKINFELRKKEDAPVWKIALLDDSDKALGEVTLAAAKDGAVLSHRGFAGPPGKKTAKAAPSSKRRKPAPIAAGPEIAPAEQPTPRPGLFDRIIRTISR